MPCSSGASMRTVVSEGTAASREGRALRNTKSRATRTTMPTKSFPNSCIGQESLREEQVGDDYQLVGEHQDAQDNEDDTHGIIKVFPPFAVAAYEAQGFGRKGADCQER